MVHRVRPVNTRYLAPSQTSSANWQSLYLKGTFILFKFVNWCSDFYVISINFRNKRSSSDFSKPRVSIWFLNLKSNKWAVIQIFPKRMFTYCFLIIIFKLQMSNILVIPNFKPNIETVIWGLDLGFRKYLDSVPHRTALRLFPCRRGEGGCAHLRPHGVLDVVLSRQYLWITRLTARSRKESGELRYKIKDGGLCAKEFVLWVYGTHDRPLIKEIT